MEHQDAPETLVNDEDAVNGIAEVRMRLDRLNSYLKGVGHQQTNGSSPQWVVEASAELLKVRRILNSSDVHLRTRLGVGVAPEIPDEVVTVAGK